MRELIAGQRKKGAATATIKQLRAALSAMFATAVEDGLLRSNPIRGARIPAGPNDRDPEDKRGKAMTRAELRLLLATGSARSRVVDGA